MRKSLEFTGSFDSLYLGNVTEVFHLALLGFNLLFDNLRDNQPFQPLGRRTENRKLEFPNPEIQNHFIELFPSGPFVTFEKGGFQILQEYPVLVTLDRIDDLRNRSLAKRLDVFSKVTQTGLCTPLGQPLVGGTLRINLTIGSGVNGGVFSKLGAVPCPIEFIRFSHFC